VRPRGGGVPPPLGGALGSGTLRGLHKPRGLALVGPGAACSGTEKLLDSHGLIKVCEEIKKGTSGSLEREDSLLFPARLSGEENPS